MSRRLTGASHREPGFVNPGTIQNGRRLHIFSAFSCSVGSFDLLDKNSLAETLIKLVGGGAVASFSSDAPAFANVSRALNVNWMRALVPECHVALPLGMAAVAAKAVAGGSQSAQKINDEKYILLGDPGFVLGVPAMGVRFEEEGSIQFQRGRVDTIYGEVFSEDGALATGFNGVVDLAIWGMADTTGYSFLDTACTGSVSNPRKNSVAYELHGPTFFRGAADVSGGRFTVPFFVPVDTRVGDLCRVRAYVVDSGARADGIGGDDSVRVIAEPPGTIYEDQTGPEVKITVNGAPMRNGISFTRSAVFALEIHDPSGINLQQNDNYFTIHVVLDRGRPVDLTSRFEYKRNSYQEGSLSFRFDDLSTVFLQEGTHELSFRAADNLNNRTELDYQVFVVAEGSELSFRSDVLNYPNPFDPGRDGSTDIVFELSQSAQVSIQILTPTGKRIRQMDEASSQVVRIPWDGRDQDGDPVANGVYLIRAVAETDDGSRSVESIGKAVVLRGAR